MDDQLDEETLLAACEEWESEGVGLGNNPQQATAVQEVPHGTPLEDLPGFDASTGHIYIYPINYPLRDYQFNIVQQALFKNTLVTLPTGLGKTFIAAVVMYNFYRWVQLFWFFTSSFVWPIFAQCLQFVIQILQISAHRRDMLAFLTSLLYLWSEFYDLHTYICLFPFIILYSRGKWRIAA